MPARDPAVSMPELQIWMKRHKPVLCAFQAQARSVDPKSNEAYYRALAQLLMAKGIVRRRSTKIWFGG
jgi:predicted deacylase